MLVEQCVLNSINYDRISSLSNSVDELGAHYQLSSMLDNNRSNCTALYRRNPFEINFEYHINRCSHSERKSVPKHYDWRSCQVPPSLWIAFLSDPIFRSSNIKLFYRAIDIIKVSLRCQLPIVIVGHLSFSRVVPIRRRLTSCRTCFDSIDLSDERGSERPYCRGSYQCRSQ